MGVGMADEVIWAVRAGKHGESEGRFVEGSRIAIGWSEVGDLKQFGTDREALKEAVAVTYPRYKPGAIPVQAGQLYRFVNEMKKGDLVVFPTKRDRMVRIGRITGDYEFVANAEHGHVNQRAVQWLKAISRAAFSQGALYEIGSAMTLFQVKSYAEEFRSALAGKVMITPVEEDSTVSVVAEGVEDNTQDFVLKRLAQEFKGHPLAQLAANLLGAMGFRTRVSPEGPDGGIDIVAHRDALGLEPPIVKVQVKSTDGTVSAPVVQQLKGALVGDEKGLLITLGTFAPQARALVRSMPNIRLVDGVELVEMLLEHYESLDNRYRAAIPLKRVYVPAPLQEGD